MILRDIVQTSGTTQSKYKISLILLWDFERIFKDQLGTTYLESSPSDFAKAAKIYLEKIEAKKVKDRQGLQTEHEDPCKSYYKQWPFGWDRRIP